MPLIAPSDLKKLDVEKVVADGLSSGCLSTHLPVLRRSALYQKRQLCAFYLRSLASDLTNSP